MKKIRNFMSKPITWGDSMKASIVAMAVSAVAVAFIYFHPIEYVRLFIAKLRNKNSEEA